MSIIKKGSGLIISKLISYGIFGVLTTIINILTFGLLDKISIDYRISTIIAWIISVIFAYITNKKYVFKSVANTKRELIKEFNSFILVRVFSLLFDIVAMYVLIDMFFVNSIISKVIANIIVIVANYFASELFIFKNINED